MPDDLLRVRISSRYRDQESDLNVVELGVLLTALNRSLNKVALQSPEIQRLIPDVYYGPIHFEPVFVQLRVTSVSRGSFELQAIIDLLATLGLDQGNARTLLLAIIGNALFNPRQTETYLYDFGRAVHRVAKGALGKTIEITIALRGAAIRLRADILESGKVKLESESSPPPDDVQ